MSEKIIFKYQCPTNREGNGCFRTSCDLCDCSPRPKMIGDPGVVKVNEEKDLKCPHTGEPLELVDVWEEAPPTTAIFGFRMNENQIRADRLTRSRNHFKKEVFDTLHPSDKEALARNDNDLKKRIKK